MSESTSAARASGGRARASRRSSAAYLSMCSFYRDRYALQTRAAPTNEKARGASRRGLSVLLAAVHLPCQRVRPNLELHDLALRAFATFNVPDEMGAVVRVQRAAFPAGVGIVDSCVHAAGVEAERVRNAEIGPLA